MTTRSSSHAGKADAGRKDQFGAATPTTNAYSGQAGGLLFILYLLEYTGQAGAGVFFLALHRGGVDPMPFLE